VLLDDGEESAEKGTRRSSVSPRVIASARAASASPGASPSSRLGFTPLARR
jgi:hypothetical protein